MKRSAVLLSWLLFASPALADDAGPEACYDAIVLATIVDQVPSIPPELEDGSILLRWPWFIDLNVEQVIEGEVPPGPLSVLSMQHSYWQADARPGRWALRRNEDGGYNLLDSTGGPKRGRCAPGASPAPAFLYPADGQSLQDMRRAGEELYGSRSAR